MDESEIPNMHCKPDGEQDPNPKGYFVHAITEDNNFCRVFEVPKDVDRITGFLHGSAVVMPFRQVDWFQPIPPPYMEPVAGRSSYPLPTNEAWDAIEDRLKLFILGKDYIRPGYQYIVWTRFGKVTMLTVPEKS